MKLSPDQKHGEAFGRLVWRGKAREKDEQIRSPLKKQWKLLQLPDYKNFTGSPDDLDKLIPKNTERTV